MNSLAHVLYLHQVRPLDESLSIAVFESLTDPFSMPGLPSLYYPAYGKLVLVGVPGLSSASLKT